MRDTRAVIVRGSRRAAIDARERDASITTTATIGQRNIRRRHFTDVTRGEREQDGSKTNHGAPYMSIHVAIIAF